MFLSKMKEKNCAGVEECLHLKYVALLNHMLKLGPTLIKSENKHPHIAERAYKVNCYHQGGHKH